MASNCPNYVDLCYANGLLREREQPFHRLSRPPHGVNQPAAFRTRGLFRMTQSVAEVSMAIAVDEHPGRYEYPVAAYPSPIIQAIC